MKRLRKTRQRPYVAPLVVAAITASLYIRTIGFDFTYDDHNHVVKNQFIRDLGNLSQFLPWHYFQREFPDQGRPVLVLTQMLDRALGGSAAVCHLQSTLWHTLTAVLVYFLSRRLGTSRAASTLAGILFGLHPVNVEAVASISNREDLLVGCFGLTVLLLAERAFRGRARALTLLGLAYAGALFAKENALAIPGLLVVLALCSERFRPPSAARRVWLRIGLTFAVVTLSWAAFQLRLGYPSLLPAAGGTGLEQAFVRSPLPAIRTLTAFRGPEAAPSAPSPSAPIALRRPQGAVSVLDAVPLEAFRAWQIVGSWPTSPEYDLSPFRSRLAFWCGAGVLVALVAAAVRSHAKSRRAALAIGWFFVATAPVSIPTLLLNPLADRYLYFATVGWSIFLAVFLMERFPPVLGRRDAGSWAALAVGMVYFGLASANVAVWQDDVSLFESARHYAPKSARVHHNLGSALSKVERYEEAERELQIAVELDPTLTAAHYNLGILAERRGDRSQAMVRYRAALDSHPVVAERPLVDRACQRLAVLLARQGERVELARLRDPASRCSAALRTTTDAFSRPE